MKQASTRHHSSSIGLEVIKATMRRYVSAAVVESVVKRAIVTNHVEPTRITHAELEAVVASSLMSLRRVIDAKVMVTLMIELTEIVAEAGDEFDVLSEVTASFSETVRVARRGW